MAFHGNMQVAIAEARTLVEAGNRVAFFASSTGEVERVADILNEYGVAYQLGLEQFDSTPAYLAERAYMAGSVRQHLPDQRRGRATARSFQIRNL